MSIAGAKYGHTNLIAKLGQGVELGAVAFCFNVAHSLCRASSAPSQREVQNHESSTGSTLSVHAQCVSVLALMAGFSGYSRHER